MLLFSHFRCTTVCMFQGWCGIDDDGNDDDCDDGDDDVVTLITR